MTQTFVRIGIGGLAGALSFAAQAQHPGGLNQPRTVVEYFDANHKKLTSAEGAITRIETQYEDSLRAVEYTFDAEGAKFNKMTFEHHRKRILHGTSERYYKNGQLHWRDTWVHGKREGELVVYYQTGQLKRREQYAAGKTKGGTCYAADGQIVMCRPFEQMPEPPGGMNGMMNYLGKNIRYPAEALRERVQGNVFVKFKVDSLGQITDLVLKQGLHPAIDAEALRVISSMPPWRPGWQDDRPVMVEYTVPLTFLMRGLPVRPKKERKGLSAPEF